MSLTVPARSPVTFSGFFRSGKYKVRALELRVIAGLHSGAVVGLHESEYTIGSDVQSDIVLRDTGVHPIHARLRSRSGRILLEAVDADLVVNGGRVVPKGAGLRCRLPIDVSFGGAQLRLQSSVDLSVDKLAFARALPTAAIVAAVCVVVVAAGNLSQAEADIGRAGEVKVPTTAAGLGRRDYAVQVSSTAVAQEFQKKLAGSGLDAVVVEEADGRLVVSGALPPSKAPAWANLQAWFDQKFGSDVVLVSNVSVGSGEYGKPRLTLQGIWHGERPYIIGGDGTRYHEGAFTNDGWLISSIGDKELILEKGGATFALNYR